MQAETIQTDTTEASAFKPGSEEYGIDLLKAQEIRSYDAVIRIANAPEKIRPALDRGLALNSDYLIGLGTIDERMIISVDINRFMSSSGMGIIENATS